MNEMGIETTIMAEVLAGRKTVEGRLRTPKFVTLRQGDTISLREDTWQDDRLVSSVPNRAHILVTKTAFFDSFESMLKAIDFKTVLPQATSLEAAIEVYRQFYTPTQEAEHGVVAISFRLL